MDSTVAVSPTARSAFPKLPIHPIRTHSSNAAAGPSRLGLPPPSGESIDLTGDSDDEEQGEDEGLAQELHRPFDLASTARRPEGSERGRNGGQQARTPSGVPSPHQPQAITADTPSQQTAGPFPHRPLPSPGQPSSSMIHDTNPGLITTEDGNDHVQVTGANILPPSNGHAGSGHPVYASTPTYAQYAPTPNGPSLASGSGFATYAPANGYPSQPAVPLTPGVWPSWAPPNGFSAQPVGANGLSIPQYDVGSSSASAIDLTSARLPSPPLDAKRPICIGAFIARAIMLYPSPAAVIGAQPPPGSKERFEVVQYRGAEFLKVKLKYRQKGSQMRRDEPWTSVKEDTIQVLTPGMSSYLGDLEGPLRDNLAVHMQRGLLRLEGFAQRLQPEAPQFEIKLNVLLFTLPSNVAYISQSLLTNYRVLMDPIPPYDPSRHNDHPPYKNPHVGLSYASQQQELRMRSGLPPGAYGSLPGLAQAQMDKAKQVEVQRKQVDEVFASLDKGFDLELSDPGPLVRTELFPHQRKALTFFLQRELDSSALKRAKKYAEKRLRKAKSRGGKGTSADGDQEKEGEKGKEAEKEQDEKGKNKHRDDSRSLWVGTPDEKGRIRTWKNKITQEERRAKKGENPNDGKGAILADDMGLGKTLSVVSLIAATRSSAKKWGKSKINSVEEAGEEEAKPSADIKPTEFAGKVFGMPSVESDDENTTKGKKRKREVINKRIDDIRQSRLVRRSKATLLVCPMSTITNWEEQLKEHWNGNVEVMGGAGVVPPKVLEAKKWKPPKKNGEPSSDEDDEDFDTLKVYVHHGSSRRFNADFIADFDVVITSYSTLAQEYSKMMSNLDDTPTSGTPGTPGDSGDETGIDLQGDTSLNSRAVKPEVEAEIKAAEVADALRKSQAKKKGKGGCKPVEVSPLQTIEWFRVVLDEAHYIKTASTVASKASCYLAADRRIALTGTPIQNKILDVWALFKFLRLDPVDKVEVFNEFIWNPCKTGDTVGVAKLQLVMRCCTLRRTKDSTAEDGRKILNLPPRHESQLWLDLREDERKAYDERVSKVREEVGQLKAEKKLGKNYAHVLQEVLRLRQICDHVDLAKTGAVEEDYDGTIMDYQVAVKGIEANGLTMPRAQSVVSYLRDGEGAVCVGCSYDYSDYFPSIGLLGGVEVGQKEERGKLKKLSSGPLLTKCLHLYCPGCFKKSIYADWSKRMREPAGRACGACDVLLRLPADVIEVEPPCSTDSAEVVEQGPKKYVRGKYVRPAGEKPNLSTKMAYLQKELMEASVRNPNSVHYNPMERADEVEELDADGKPFVTKSVVFSQWTTMLDRIGDMLDEIGIKYARLDGTMTREDRAKATEALRLNKKVEVLLVSTRAGGVGLNLTAACRCFLVDPYWNPSVEQQAIDRIHRMGQKRPVTAIKLMIKDSIEMKLDEIQKKKANLAQLSLKNMSRTELMAQKAEELASLFS